MQRKAHPAGTGETVPPPRSGGGSPLRPDLRAMMEAAFGGSFGAVRVHEDPYAQAIGALAFTRGDDIFFAPGQFNPETPKGLALIGHELGHVKQQAEGRVPVNAQIGGAPANDDPALEHEADELGAKAARGGAGRGLEGSQAAAGQHASSAPAASANQGTLQAKVAEETADAALPASQPRIEELAGPDAAEAIDPGAAAMPPIQRAPTGTPQKAKKSYIPFNVTVAKPMTREEFEAAANLQVFGSASVAGQWHNVKDAYTPDQSPVEVLFEASLVHRLRGAANAAKGIDTDASGKVAGADERAKGFEAQPGSDDRAALLREIDRRYYAASGMPSGAKIQSLELGKSDLWRSIRDEVLFQHQYIANLPDKVKALIHASIQGRDLTPADYDQLFRIAKQIESLPPGAAADYANKITGVTADLSAFEAAIGTYRAELAEREQADTERTTVQNKLLGLEEVYKLYRQYRAAGYAEARSASKSGLVKRDGTGPGVGDQLQQQLPRYGFASIAEFAAYIARFEQAFEDGAARITLGILAKYAGKLYKESQRYQDPAVIKDLHGKLGRFRTQQQAFDKNAQIWNDYAAQHNQDVKQQGLPGNGGIHARPPTPEQAQAGEKARAAKASAEASIKDLSKDYPIFAEDDVPVDKRLDKVKLAQASEAHLAGVIQAHIAERTSVVVEARGQLEGKHALIYKMAKLMPAFYAEMDIQPGSIHDQIIQDKLHDDAIAKLVGGILLAIVAVALTVVSLGTATPAIIAAGASIGAAGLSTYMAYDEYKEYTAEHAVAEAGFADDPSMTWLVLAIVGAGVDMAAAAKALRALAPAAKLLKSGDEISDFAKAVQELQKSKEIDEKIAAAANNAAAARKSYAAAKGELSAALGKAYSLPGPLTDPEVYRALVKMAAAKIKEGGHSLAGFIAELKQARLAAKLGELAPEELARAKQAWAQAEALLANGKIADGAMLERLLVNAKVADATMLERLLANAKVIDGATLERLLANGKIADGATLERLLADAKMADVAALERLLADARIADSVTLERLLGNAKITDAKLLGKLADKVSSLDELERLLNAVNRGEELEKLLRRMSSTELEKFIVDLDDLSKMREFAEMYGGDTLKHYGSQFFKDFKGIDDDTLKHLSAFDGLDKKTGIKGCHDEDLFRAQMAMPADGVISPPPGAGRGPIINTTPHPSDPAVKRFEYSFWRQDAKGNLISPLNPKAATFLKTTIKDLAGSTAKWQASAMEAVEEAIRKMLFPKGDASFSGVSKSGLKWSGWYRGGKIQTVFVDF